MCLSTNDSARLIETGTGSGRNDSIKSDPLVANDRRLKANDVELVSDMITKERDVILQRLRKTGKITRISLDSLIARDVEIHVINDPCNFKL